MNFHNLRMFLIYLGPSIEEEGKNGQKKEERVEGNYRGKDSFHRVEHGTNSMTSRKIDEGERKGK